MTIRELVVVGFTVVALSMVALWAVSLAGRLERIGVVMDALLARRGSRLLLVALWAWLGWHLLVRTG